MNGWFVPLGAAAIVGGFTLMCHQIGSTFLKNLKRKNPGEKYTGNVDISFYEKSPVRKMTADGIAYMDSRPCEDVYIQSHDNLKLHGLLYPADGNPKKFVLGIHGFQSNPKSQYGPFIEFYHSLGFSMLLPDDRAHGYSEGEYITMGVKDRLDCINWARYLVARFGPDAQILLHGVSMGGATVLSASAEDELPEQVFGVVSDCGFTSVTDSFTYQIQASYHISPAFPLKICKWYAKHRAGFDAEEAQPIDRVPGARVPILFVQGEDDIMVPHSMAERLYAACGSPKRLLMVPHANHAESIAIDTEGYHQAIRQMFGI